MENEGEERVIDDPEVFSIHDLLDGGANKDIQAKADLERKAMCSVWTRCIMWILLSD